MCMIICITATVENVPEDAPIFTAASSFLVLASSSLRAATSSSTEGVMSGLPSDAILFQYSEERTEKRDFLLMSCSSHQLLI
jgi:hypothetical protein